MVSWISCYNSLSPTIENFPQTMLETQHRVLLTLILFLFTILYILTIK